MFKVAICEDDKKQREDIKQLLINREYSDIYEIVTFDSGESLIEAYKDGRVYSMLLLDVQMGELDGIKTAEIIRQYDEGVIIILITSELAYAVEGYNINAIDFILKPIDVKKFDKVLDRGIEKLRSNHNNVYTITRRDVLKRIKLSDIMYFESEKKNVIIHSRAEKLTDYTCISVVERKLKDLGFIRISRFYLLNMSFVSEIRNDEIVLINGEVLRYNKKLQRLIKETYMHGILEEM